MYFRKIFWVKLFIIFFLCSCKKEQFESKTVLKNKKSNTTVETDKQIGKMLISFYTFYLGEFSNPDLKESERKLDSIKVKYCTKRLLDSISNEFGNNELDYDPFIKVQDASSDMIGTLTVNKTANFENKFNVQYFEKYSGNKTNIEVIVVNENGNFKISSLK